jgi:hypothetical protein
MLAPSVFVVAFGQEKKGLIQTHCSIHQLMAERACWMIIYPWLPYYPFLILFLLLLS